MRHLKEEQLRQQLITYLCNVKQFPRSLIVQEKKISILPNINRKCCINRRVDLLIYTPQLKPLLLIECKSVVITSKAIHQVLGYNYYIGALCIGIVNQTECMLQWKQESNTIYPNWKSFPSYERCMNTYLQYE